MRPRHQSIEAIVRSRGVYTKSQKIELLIRATKIEVQKIEYTSTFFDTFVSGANLEINPNTSLIFFILYAMRRLIRGEARGVQGTVICAVESIVKIMEQESGSMINVLPQTFLGLFKYCFDNHSTEELKNKLLVASLAISHINL